MNIAWKVTIEQLLEHNQYEAVFNLGFCNKQFNKIIKNIEGNVQKEIDKPSKDLFIKNRNLAIKYIKARNYIAINQLLKERTKRCYLNLFKLSCKYDWYDLFQVTVMECLTSHLTIKNTLLKYSGGWKLVNLERLIKEYIEEPNSVKRMEIGEKYCVMKIVDVIRFN
jgi:hypothetical protein